MRLFASTSGGWQIRKEAVPWITIPLWRFRSENPGSGGFEMSMSWMPNIPEEFMEQKFKNWNKTFDDYFEPPAFKLRMTSSSSVLLQWSEPTRPGNITVEGYRISYSIDSEKDDKLVYHGPITISNASANKYLFRKLGKVK